MQVEREGENDYVMGFVSLWNRYLQDVEEILLFELFLVKWKNCFVKEDYLLKRI